MLNLAEVVVNAFKLIDYGLTDKTFYGMKRTDPEDSVVFVMLMLQLDD